MYELCFLDLVWLIYRFYDEQKYEH